MCSVRRCRYFPTHTSLRQVLLKGTELPGTGSDFGKAKSPIPGEFRMLADERLARDSRTACEWQSFISASLLSPAFYLN